MDAEVYSKSVQTFCFWKYIWLNRAAGDLNRAEVYMPIWRKGGDRLRNKPIPNKVGRNCFHYSLMGTSKRVFTEDARSIKAILHAEKLWTRESCIHVLERKGGLEDTLHILPHVYVTFTFERYSMRGTTHSCLYETGLGKSPCTSVE